MADQLATPFRYTMKIRNVAYGADSLALLSEIYSRVRGASGEGCSTFRPVNVSEGGVEIGHVSYNGRIWDQPLNAGLWMPPCLDTSKLLFDNRMEPA